jgi:hypothetical protein
MYFYVLCLGIFYRLYSWSRHDSSIRKILLAVYLASTIDTKPIFGSQDHDSMDNVFLFSVRLLTVFYLI